MYIQKLVLENIRCFEKLELVLGNGHGNSLLLCGDNGDGKSTVLRALAIGLCDQSSAAALQRELSGDFVRKNADENGSIKITLRNENGDSYFIHTEFEPLEAFERVTQNLKINDKKIEERDFPWQDLFVSAYGTGVRCQGTLDFDHYLAVDAVYHLFKHDSPLQNPELAYRRLITPVQKDGMIGKIHSAYDMFTESNELVKFLNEKLLRVLNLGDDSAIYLSETGLEIKRDNERFNLSSQGDGHKAITTLMLDLFSWWSLWLKLNSKEFESNKEISGIVLIDEIEQHLHPKLQMEVFSLLQKSFPLIQFVTTTHSPLVIAGATESEEAEISTLFRTISGEVESNTVPAKQFTGYRADQVLTSDLFGLKLTVAGETGKDLIKLKNLFLIDNRSTEEEEELKKLKLKISQTMPQVAETQIEMDRQRRLLKEIEELKELIKGGENDKS